MSDLDKDKNLHTTPDEEAREEAETQGADKLEGAEPDERDFLEETEEADEAAQRPETAAAAAPAAKPGMPAWPWVGVSVVAVAALAFVLIAKPFGGANEKIGQFDGGKVTKLDMYDEIKSQVPESQFTGMVDAILEKKLIAKLADEAGVKVTDEQIDKELANYETNYGGKDAFQSQLDQAGISLQTFKDQQIAPMLLEKNLYISQHPAKEEDYKAYFDANPDTFATTPKQIKASHILVDTKEEADAILADLKAGKDFATLAKQKSKDTGSAANGGDLGDFFGKGAMVAEFEDAAFKLKKGELSDVVQTQYGFHIIKVTDVKEAVIPPYDEKKADVEDAYWADQLGKNETTWLDKLKEDNHVKNLVEAEEPAASPEASAPAASEKPAASEPAASPSASAAQ